MSTDVEMGIQEIQQMLQEESKAELEYQVKLHHIVYLYIWFLSILLYFIQPDECYILFYCFKRKNSKVI